MLPRSLRCLRSAFVLALVVSSGGLLLACSRDEKGAEAPSSVSSSPASRASTEAATSGGLFQELPRGGEAPRDAGLCGFKLCAPIFSSDACEKDDDCAPSVPCHAHECVARAKATPRAPDLQCTMVLDPLSTDVNRCGCLEKRCAIGVPKKP